MSTIKAWHFVKANGKRRGGLIEEAGKTYHFDGDPVMCNCGLHASRRLIDALKFAPGTRLRRVSCWGLGAEDQDKLVCRHRKVLWEMDVTMILHEFACRVAEDALRTAKAKDERSWNAIRVKRAWIKGEATDGELTAVGNAAWGDAVYAARDTAWGAGWGAALGDAKTKYNTWLTEMVEEARDE